MNFGLSQLWKEGRFKNYDAFFLLTNDTELLPVSTVARLMDVMDKHPLVGILSPCSERWGEKFLFQSQTTKYFWFIHNNAFLLRREFIESKFAPIAESDQANLRAQVQREMQDVKATGANGKPTSAYDSLMQDKKLKFWRKTWA